MRGVKYYIWLAESFPYGSVKPSKILETVDDLPQFYQDQKAYRKALPFLTLADWDALQKTSLSACEAIIEQCLKIGGRILCYDDSEYPERLKNIYAPPVVLYTKGHVDGLDSEVAITVVGTR